MHKVLGREDTLRLCNEKLRSQPDSLAANFAMYNMVLMGGEYNKAVRYIDKCIEITEPNSPWRSNLIIKKANALERAYIKTKDTRYVDMAINEYESILKETPNNASVLNNMAYMLAVTGRDLDKALQSAQLACELQPGAPDYLDTQALILYKMGQYPKAAEVERAAIQLYEQGKAAVAPVGVGGWVITK